MSSRLCPLQCAALSKLFQPHYLHTYIEGLRHVQRSDNGVHTHEPYHELQARRSQQHIALGSEVTRSPPTSGVTVEVGDLNSVSLFGSLSEAGSETLHVSSCPVTGQLPLRPDKQAALPIIDEEISRDGNSSTGLASGDTQSLAPLHTQVNTDAEGNCHVVLQCTYLFVAAEW